MFCHVDSRLEQNGCLCSESKGRARERKNEAWRRGGGRERKHRRDAGTQSGASNSLPSNAGRQNLSIITKTGKDWHKNDT